MIREKKKKLVGQDKKEMPSQLTLSLVIQDLPTTFWDCLRKYIYTHSNILNKYLIQFFPSLLSVKLIVVQENGNLDFDF